ncbi:MAG: hypothetical protein RLZZ424_523 [Bacteroidota bacterium]|jgi:adenine-specific DNA-methyltransferase
MSEIQKQELTSMNLTEEQLHKFKEIFPEVFTEGLKVDWDKLRLTLGQSIDVGKERYGMNWPGKADCFKTIQQPSVATLIPARKESVNFDTTENLFIEGDNLEVLKLLQKSYIGKIKIISIDPPYNTGKDFIYPDNYTENLETYLEYTGQVGADGKKFGTNTDTDGRYHSRWLNMMYPRLFLAKNLLTEDGVIFISIDDAEVLNLTAICNEIFGEENFRGNIIRATGTTTGQDAKKIGSSFDYCLCYSKSASYSLKGLPLSGKDLNRFNNDDNDGKGKYALLQLRKTGNADRKEDRESMFFPITAPDGTPVYPIGPSDYLSRWRVGKAKLNQFISENLIVWKEVLDDADEEDDLEDDDDLEVDSISDDSINNSDLIDDIDITEYKSKWRPYVKYYLSGRTKQVSNLWNDIDGNKKGSIELKKLFDKKKVFDNPKPTSFIKRQIEISCEDSDIFLDFFAGSGSSAHAVLEYNYEKQKNIKFITVQLPEPTTKKTIAFKSGFKTISEITKSRIERVINSLSKSQEDKLEKNKSLLFSNENFKIDLGFKVFKLSKSNFKIWDNTLEKEPEVIQVKLFEHIKHISPESEQEAILFELFLKSGFELTTPIEKLTLSGKTVFSIADGQLLICLEKELTLDCIKEMAGMQPSRVICLDEAFNGENADSLKTNAVQIMKSKGVVNFRTI